MKTEAKVIADSMNPAGVRLTTMEATFPRFVLPQLLNHRMFSRSTTSSRAQGIQGRMTQVLDHPVIPSFGSNQKGMQAGEPLSGADLEAATKSWLDARTAAVHQARRLQRLGVHKEVANRLLEPWTWTTTVISSTTWSNFFNLRCEEEGPQVEIRDLALAMRDALSGSVPAAMPLGGYHTPYVTPSPQGATQEEIEVSVARCARASYNTQAVDRPVEDDLNLYKRLVEESHASPLEHVAMAADGQWSGNFGWGWRQMRDIMEGMNHEH